MCRTQKPDIMRTPEESCTTQHPRTSPWEVRAGPIRTLLDQSRFTCAMHQRILFSACVCRQHWSRAQGNIIAVGPAARSALQRYAQALVLVHNSLLCERYQIEGAQAPEGTILEGIKRLIIACRVLVGHEKKFNCALYPALCNQKTGGLKV